MPNHTKVPKLRNLHGLRKLRRHRDTWTGSDWDTTPVHLLDLPQRTLRSSAAPTTSLPPRHDRRVYPGPKTRPHTPATSGVPLAPAVESKYFPLVAKHTYDHRRVTEDEGTGWEGQDPRVGRRKGHRQDTVRPATTGVAGTTRRTHRRRSGCVDDRRNPGHRPRPTTTVLRTPAGETL